LVFIEVSKVVGIGIEEHGFGVKWSTWGTKLVLERDLVKNLLVEHWNWNWNWNWILIGCQSVSIALTRKKLRGKES